jgi:hypothetical protein
MIEGVVPICSPRSKRKNTPFRKKKMSRDLNEPVPFKVCSINFSQFLGDRLSVIACSPQLQIQVKHEEAEHS